MQLFQIGITFFEPFETELLHGKAEMHSQKIAGIPSH